MVVNHGFSQITNPCEGLGVICHGADFTLVGMAACGESTLDCVKVLQQSMPGCLSESQIRLDGNTVFGIEDMEALVGR
jgi:hypothetical protein